MVAGMARLVVLMPRDTRAGLSFTPQLLASHQPISGKLAPRSRAWARYLERLTASSSACSSPVPVPRWALPV